MAEVARTRAPLRQIVGRKRDRFVLLDPDDILYFIAESGLIKARTAQDSYVVNYQLSELEEKAERFVLPRPAIRIGKS